MTKVTTGLEEMAYRLIYFHARPWGNPGSPGIYRVGVEEEYLQPKEKVPRSHERTQSGNGDRVTEAEAAQRPSRKSTKYGCLDTINELADEKFRVTG